MKKAIAAAGIGVVAIALSSGSAHASENVDASQTALEVKNDQGNSADANSIENPEGEIGSYENVVSYDKTSPANDNLAELNDNSAEMQGRQKDNSIDYAQKDVTDVRKTEKNVNRAGQLKNDKDRAVVSSAGLNIRVNPNVSERMIGTLGEGEEVKVLERQGGWAKVQTKNGIGWVSGYYVVGDSKVDNVLQNQPKKAVIGSSKENVKVISTEQKDPSYIKTSGKVVSYTDLNVRMGPGTSTSVIGTASKGQVVNIIEESDGWYKVITDSGLIGWCSGAYITQIEEPTSITPNATDSVEADKASSKIEEKKAEQQKTDSIPASAKGNQVVKAASRLLGTPYVWGGSTTNGFDCSGFTQYVFKNSLGINIPRVSSQQAAGGKAVAKGQYQVGDLVYFATTERGTTSHVGIYIGDNMFIHASGTPSNPDRVKVDSLGSSYWQKALLGARRYS